MKGLMLLLPMLQLAAGQNTLTVIPSVDSGTAPTLTVAPSVGSNLPTTTITASFDGTAYTSVVIPVVLTVESGVTLYSYMPVPETTIAFSVASANGTVVTLTAGGTATGTSPPVVDTTLYPSNGLGVNTTATSTSGTHSGTATSSKSGPASFTNAAPTADAKLGLGILGFAGVVAAVGL